MKPRLLVPVIAAAALVISGAAVIIMLANRPGEESTRPFQDPRPTATSTTDQLGCPNRVIVYFKTDEAMQRAFPQFDNDSRFYDPVRETKLAAYERFKVIFKDQPDLIAITRPEALPASVSFSLQPGVDKHEVLAELRQSYPPSDVPDPCEFLSRPNTASTTPSR